jgi:hypothetical protein
MAKKAFRSVHVADEGCDDLVLIVIVGLPALVALVMNLVIAANLVSLSMDMSFADIPADVAAGFIYIISALGTACVIDQVAVIFMFFKTRALVLNWIASIGVVCAGLKLAMVNKVRNYDTMRAPTVNLAYDLVSGDLQLNALIRDGSQWHWEAHFGNICCIYLATFFAFKVFTANRFRVDKLKKKSVYYFGASLTMAAFGGFFSPANGSAVGWLLLLHMLILVWAFFQSQVHLNMSKVVE